LTNYIVAILDRSGSMAGSESDVIGGFNSFLNLQKENIKDIDNTKVVLVLFDNVIELVHNQTPLRNVHNIDNSTYFVRGSTSLLDAVGQTFSHTPTDAGRVAVMIYTDGYENSSKEWTKDGVKRLMAEKKKLDWQILFGGADMDAFSEARSMGIDWGSTIKLGKTRVENRAYFDTVGTSAFSYMNTGKVETDAQTKFTAAVAKEAQAEDKST